MAELFAKANGCCKGKSGSMHVGDMRVGMPPAIAIVGANVPVAAGMALTQRRLDTDGVTLVEVAPDWHSRLLSIISNPNIAYIMLLVGIYGLIR